VIITVTIAQDAKSTAAAKQLTEVLDRLKLDAIAAPDPADAGTFVAALYFQGGQLLVVSAKYSAPALLTAKLAKKDYRDVYIDLNAASIAGSKIFVMDQTCDGLVAKPGEQYAFEVDLDACSRCKSCSVNGWSSLSFT